MRHHGPQGVLEVSLRFASAAAQGDADSLLARLVAAIDGRSQGPAQPHAMTVP
jgi:hypothetical protein